MTTKRYSYIGAIGFYLWGLFVGGLSWVNEKESTVWDVLWFTVGVGLLIAGVALIVFGVSKYVKRRRVEKDHMARGESYGRGYGKE